MKGGRLSNANKSDRISPSDPGDRFDEVVMGSAEIDARQLHYKPSAADKDMFYALVASADRRRESRQPSGSPATACRLIHGRELDRHDVLVSDVSARGVGLRSPIPLEKGSIYKLHPLGEEATLIRVVRSRKRLDGTFDVGAVHI